MRDSLAADPQHLEKEDAPGVANLSVEHAHLQDMPGRSALSPQCSSPCPSFVDASVPIRSEVSLNADACRSSLGDRTFRILRNAMLQQQETFLDHLWELHRLARAQGRKAALLAAESQLAPAQAEAQAPILSQQQEFHMHQSIMQSIHDMQFIPASLRRPVVIAQPEPVLGACVPMEGTKEQPGKAQAAVPMPKPAHEVPQAPVNPQLSQKMRSANFPGPLMISPLGMNMPYFQQGIGCNAPAEFGFQGDPNSVSFQWPPSGQFPAAALPAFHAGALSGYGKVAQSGAQLLHGLQMPSGSLGRCAPSFATTQVQGAASSATKTQVPIHLQQPGEAQPSHLDMSSFLGLVAPGMGAQPDLHSQWFAKNLSGANSPPDLSSALLGMQGTMDAVPTPAMIEKGFAPEASLSNPSASVWSGSTLVVPGMSHVPSQQIGQLGPGGECAVSGSMPLSAAPVPGLGDSLFAACARTRDTPAQTAGAGAAGTFSVEACAFQQNPALAGQVATGGSKGHGGICHTDESAASILMSLKGSS